MKKETTTKKKETVLSFTDSECEIMKRTAKEKFDHAERMIKFISKSTNPIFQLNPVKINFDDQLLCAELIMKNPNIVFQKKHKKLFLEFSNYRRELEAEAKATGNKKNLVIIKKINALLKTIPDWDDFAKAERSTAKKFGGKQKYFIVQRIENIK